MGANILIQCRIDSSERRLTVMSVINSSIFATEFKNRIKKFSDIYWHIKTSGLCADNRFDKSDDSTITARAKEYRRKIFGF